MENNIENILNILPLQLKKYFCENGDRNLTEIRIREGFDIKVSADGQYVTIKNTKTDKQYINNLYYKFCDNTVSAYEDQTGQGFLTLEGGHRVGLTGKFITDNQGKTIVSDVYSMNIRLCRLHIINVDNQIMNFRKGLLIAGRPHSGKTNYIRNICNLLHNKNVVVCDERSELYSPQLDCDFIINLPKHVAVMQALRTMNPDYIVCDELGTEKETASLLNGLGSGVKFICSVHAENYEDFANKPNIKLLLDSKVFDKIVFLERAENNFFVRDIYDL